MCADALKTSPYANFVFFLVTGMQKRISTISLTDAPIQIMPTKRKLKMSQEYSSVLLIYSVYYLYIYLVEKVKGEHGKVKVYFTLY